MNFQRVWVTRVHLEVSVQVYCPLNNWLELWHCVTDVVDHSVRSLDGSYDVFVDFAI